MQYNTTGLWIWYFRIISFHVYPCITSTSTCLMAHAVSQPQVQEMRRVSLNWRWRKLVQHTAVPRPYLRGARGLRRRRILRTKTEASLRHKTSPLPPLPLQLWGSQHEQGNIYEYYEYTRIYIASMADYWQVFLAALAVELFRKSLLALRYLRETLQRKTLAFTFWLESRRALNCWYQPWWFQTLKESRESMQYKVDWSFCAWLLELVLTNSTAELFKSIQGLQRARKRLVLIRIKKPAACRIWDLAKEVTGKWRLLTSRVSGTQITKATVTQ